MNNGTSFLGIIEAAARSPQTARDARRAAELGDAASARIESAVTKAGIVALLVLAFVVLK